MTHPQGFASMQAFAIPGIPAVKQGCDVGRLILDAIAPMDLALLPSDVFVVAQKIVSKAEGRTRQASAIEAGPEARDIAARSGKNAAKVQAILDESSEILRVVNVPPDGVVIARHKAGWVCANAGIDESNLGDDLAADTLLLLPEDPDASARRIAEAIADATGVRPGVIISDTFGRPWRRGLLNVAIGVDGVVPIVDWVGKKDAYGRRLNVSQQALADEIAAASGLLMAKDAATPVILFRGIEWDRSASAHAVDYVRHPNEDLFK